MMNYEMLFDSIAIIIYPSILLDDGVLLLTIPKVEPKVVPQAKKVIEIK